MVPHCCCQNSYSEPPPSILNEIKEFFQEFNCIEVFYYFLSMWDYLQPHLLIASFYCNQINYCNRNEQWKSNKRMSSTCFSEGCTNTEDDPCTGCPSTARSVENIECIHQIVRSERQQTTDNIVSQVHLSNVCRFRTLFWKCYPLNRKKLGCQWLVDVSSNCRCRWALPQTNFDWQWEMVLSLWFPSKISIS